MSRWPSIFVTALVAAMGATASPAEATFPGVNGPVAYLFARPYKDVYYGADIRELPGDRLSARFVLDCSWNQNLGNPIGDCTGTGGMAVSPDGRKLAVVAHVGLGAAGRSVVEILPDDGGDAMLVPLPELPMTEPYAYYGHVRWSPDGTRLLVARLVASGNGPAPAGVLVLGSDGSEPRVLDPRAGDPDWSVRGDIAFVRDGDLHVLAPGSEPRRLTWRGAARPSWSPDGETIAFDRGCRQPPRTALSRRCAAYLISATGGKAKLLAKRATEPVWSPDGRSVAFVRTRWTTIREFSEFKPFVATIDVRTKLTTYLRGRPFSASDWDEMTALEWLARP
jgi:hypothetical protein